MAQLNEALAAQQNVTDDQREQLNTLYDHLEQLLRDSSPESHPAETVAELRLLEFQLQSNWNFPRDPDFHVYWDKLNGCRCPSTDNSERFGQPKIHAEHCPYHGAHTWAGNTRPDSP